MAAEFGHMNMQPEFQVCGLPSSGMAHVRVADADKWTCLNNGSTWLVHQVAGAAGGASV